MTKTPCTITAVSPARQDIAGLIQELDQFQNSLYPPESMYQTSIKELDQDDVHFVAAFIEGEPVGTGAVKIFAEKGYGEIKRLYVSPKFRNRGIARLVTEHLESFLVSKDIFIARLETGTRHDEGITFYLKMGYWRCERFGDFPVDPLSIYMEKKLKPIIRFNGRS